MAISSPILKALSRPPPSNQVPHKSARLERGYFQHSRKKKLLVRLPQGSRYPGATAEG